MFSLAAPMAISGNCRFVFGPYFQKDPNIVHSHQSFLCLFGHSNNV